MELVEIVIVKKKKSSFLYSQSFLLIFIFLLHGIYLDEENILANVLSNSQVLIKHSMEEILSNACFRLHVEQPNIVATHVHLLMTLHEKHKLAIGNACIVAQYFARYCAFNFCSQQCTSMVFNTQL
jgi:hypothetical protein